MSHSSYFFIALALLPVVSVVLKATWAVLVPLSAEGRSFFPFLAGLGAYLIYHLFFHRPVGLYVLGHEMTHALAAFLTGCEVKSLRASPKGGEVILGDSNVLVALAPYCFPIYNVLVIGLLFLIQHYARFTSPPMWFGFLAGATLSFHFVLTLHALLQHQPDLRHAGTFPSLTFILLANCGMLLLLMKAVYPASVSFPAFIEACRAEAVSYGRLLADLAGAAARWAGSGGNGLLLS